MGVGLRLEIEPLEWRAGISPAELDIANSPPFPLTCGCACTLALW
jgi:hypothetical protein